MRTIEVDEEVFAEIWRKHHSGDRNENSILRRVFGLDRATSLSGFVDPRSGVIFPKGFEIYRNRNGIKRWATAMDGHWLLDDGQIALTLSKLSDLVGATTESAWEGWWYSQDEQAFLIKEYRSRYLAAMNMKGPRK